MNEKTRKIGRTGFLVVLLEIIVECIVGAIWAVIKAVSQRIRLRLCKRRPTPREQDVLLGQRLDPRTAPYALGLCIRHRSTNNLGRWRNR